jgi:hypothetical protein
MPSRKLKTLDLPLRKQCKQVHQKNLIQKDGTSPMFKKKTSGKSLTLKHLQRYLLDAALESAISLKMGEGHWMLT